MRTIQIVKPSLTNCFWLQTVRLPKLEIRLTAVVTSRQGMLTPPRHLIPPVHYITNNVSTSRKLSYYIHVTRRQRRYFHSTIGRMQSWLSCIKIECVSVCDINVTGFTHNSRYIRSCAVSHRKQPPKMYIDMCAFYFWRTYTRSKYLVFYSVK
jgi:hypothetical protein